MIDRAPDLRVTDLEQAANETVRDDDAALDALVDQVPLDMLQLHGSESPDRVAEIRERFGLPVMKAGVMNWWENYPTIALDVTEVWLQQ